MDPTTYEDYKLPLKTTLICPSQHIQMHAKTNKPALSGAIAEVLGPWLDDAADGMTCPSLELPKRSS